METKLVFSEDVQIEVSDVFFFTTNISYDEKPINYPFSESDFVTAKNFFADKINDIFFLPSSEVCN